MVERSTRRFHAHPETIIRTDQHLWSINERLGALLALKIPWWSKLWSRITGKRLEVGIETKEPDLDLFDDLYYLDLQDADDD